MLEIAVSGQLQLPEHSSAPPDSARLARSVARLVEYVTSLSAQQETSDVSENTTMEGAAVAYAYEQVANVRVVPYNWHAHHHAWDPNLGGAGLRGGGG